MNRIKALVKSDTKNISRDFIMLLGIVLPVLLVPVFRFLIPFIGTLVKDYVDLTLYYPLITALYILMGPLMMGWMVGFFLLDERDEQTLLAISVTPLGKSGYLTYRLVSALVLNILLTFLLLPFASTVKIDILRTIPVVLLSALEAPIFALILASVASNKVEGLAIGKGLGMMDIPCILPLFVPAPWHYLGGILPTYWVTQAFRSIYHEPGMYWIYIAGGVAVHAIYIWILLRVFNRKIG